MNNDAIVFLKLLTAEFESYLEKFEALILLFSCLLLLGSFERICIS